MEGVTITPPSLARSRNMAAIRSKNTTTELYVRSAVHGAGFRYRLHARTLPGKPDLVFSRYHLAAFVHGCFWHGHECMLARRPSTNTSYWNPKIEGNIRRDRRNVARLRRRGWSVVILRECHLDRDIRRLLDKLDAMRTQACTS